jgi:hypothetical protein
MSILAAAEPSLEILELQKIIHSTFNQATYDADEEKLHNQRSSAQQVPPSSAAQAQAVVRISANQEDSALLRMLPLELLAHAVSFLDIQTILMKVALTCRLLREVTTIPNLYPTLTPYFLAEFRPHSAPRNLTFLKTINTKDGILKLATLHTVTTQDLVEWFGQERLQRVFQRQTLPASLASLSAEGLLDCYAVCKVGLAANPHVEGQANPVRDAVLTLIPSFENLQQIYQQPGFTSLNLLRIGTLHTADINQYYSLMENMLQIRMMQRGPVALVESKKSFDHTLEGVLVREILLAGRSVQHIYRNHYLYTDQKKEAARQLFHWCHTHRLQESGLSHLIHDANYLELNHMAYTMVLSLLDYPHDELHTKVKLEALTPYYNHYYNSTSYDADFAKLQSEPSFRDFCQAVYPTHWASLNLGEKMNAFRLLIKARKFESIPGALTDLLTQGDIYPSIALSYVETLSEANQLESARRLTEYLLHMERNKLFSGLIHSFSQFCDYGRRANLSSTVSLVREVLTLKRIEDPFGILQTMPPACGNPLVLIKIQALKWLAKHAGAQEGEFITREAKSLESDNGKDDNPVRWDSDWFVIHYHLRNVDLCRSFYRKLVDVLAEDDKTIDQVLTALRQKGKATWSIERLRSLDPIEMVQTMFPNALRLAFNGTLSDSVFSWTTLYDCAEPSLGKFEALKSEPRD